MSDPLRDGVSLTSPGAIRLATDAACDSFTRVALGDLVEARLLAQRSGEAAAQSLLNQDYALLLGDDDGRSLTFCVCDGVGSSFSGDFAATYLAMRLTRWLAAQSLTDADAEDQLSAALIAEMRAWAEAAQEQLRRRAISTAGGALVHEALTELRDTYGSETVFFAGRVDIGADGCAEALLCWMGNVAARLYSDNSATTPLHVSEDDASRWSTARGLRGRLGMTRLSWSLPRRLIIHTDGANPLSASLVILDDDAAQAEARRLQERPGADDLTALDIAWRVATTESAGTTGEKES